MILSFLILPHLQKKEERSIRLVRVIKRSIGFVSKRCPSTLFYWPVRAPFTLTRLFFKISFFKLQQKLTGLSVLSDAISKPPITPSLFIILKATISRAYSSMLAVQMRDKTILITDRYLRFLESRGLKKTNSWHLRSFLVIKRRRECGSWNNHPIKWQLILLDWFKELGLDDIFGVPGDFVFFWGGGHAIEKSDIRYICTCNEINAAYAADGYARRKGLGALLTTYVVRELGAINGCWKGSYRTNYRMPCNKTLRG